MTKCPDGQIDQESGSVREEHLPTIETGTQSARCEYSDSNRIEAAIAGADEITDPLKGLVEKCADNPGAVFEPDILEQLTAFKKEDRIAFKELRRELKEAGCLVTVLDKAIGEIDGNGGRGPTQADILIDLAGTADLFHDTDGTPYADIEINGHRETWSVRSKGIRQWLVRQFFEETGRAPNSEALNSVLNVMEARAQIDGPERRVFIRVGSLDDRLYLDLCNEAWQAVEITNVGWRVIDNPPVRFRRAAGMEPLPTPVGGGSIEALRSYLNVQSDNDFVLVVAWALAVLRNRGPYPVIVLSGEQGSAKSTFSAILRSLLDPNTAPLRTLPREDRDLFIAAKHGHVLAFDNISGLSPWISDALCRLATGGSLAVRQLFTDHDEVLFSAVRPIVLNGIEDIVTRPDLADRAVFLTLEPIPEERRRSEEELWAAFNAEHPRILGVLLDAVVRGLKTLPETKLKQLPRMADFALWGTACETEFWSSGTFMSAYTGNRYETIENVIEGDLVATAVRTLMAQQKEWTGTATDLLDKLSEVKGERTAKPKNWPTSPHSLSGRLRRVGPLLRKIGIEIGFDRKGRAGTRIIRITAMGSSTVADHGGTQPSAPSALSAFVLNGNEIKGFDDTTVRTVDGAADGKVDAEHNRTGSTVRANSLNSSDTDGADASDANNPPSSIPEKNGPFTWCESP